MNPGADTLLSAFAKSRMVRNILLLVGVAGRDSQEATVSWNGAGAGVSGRINKDDGGVSGRINKDDGDGPDTQVPSLNGVTSHRHGPGFM